MPGREPGYRSQRGSSSPSLSGGSARSSRSCSPPGSACRRCSSCNSSFPSADNTALRRPALMHPLFSPLATRPRQLAAGPRSETTACPTQSYRPSATKGRTMCPRRVGYCSRSRFPRSRNGVIYAPSPGFARLPQARAAFTDQPAHPTS